MNILIETTRNFSRNNKHQRGDSFRTYGKEGKKSIPRMGWFIASGIVEIINVRWPFITWWSKKGNLINELNLKNCVHLKIKTTSKFFVGITYKKIGFIIHPEFFDAKNIFSHPFIQNLKHKPNMVQDMSIQMKIPLKRQILDNSVR